MKFTFCCELWEKHKNKVEHTFERRILYFFLQRKLFKQNVINYFLLHTSKSNNGIFYKLRNYAWQRKILIKYKMLHFKNTVLIYSILTSELGIQFFNDFRKYLFWKITLFWNLIKFLNFLENFLGCLYFSFKF